MLPQGTATNGGKSTRRRSEGSGRTETFRHQELSPPIERERRGGAFCTGSSSSSLKRSKSVPPPPPWLAAGLVVGRLADAVVVNLSHVTVTLAPTLTRG